MKKLLILTLVFILASACLPAQNYYEDAFAHLKDEKFYPQIDKALNSEKTDKLLDTGTEAYRYYHNKKQNERALFLFNIASYYASGYGHGKEALKLIKKKRADLRKQGDSMNVHYGTLVYNHALLLNRSFLLEKSKPVFHTAIQILENCPDTPPLHLYALYKTTAFLHVYLYENKEAYRLANKALDGFLSVSRDELSAGAAQKLSYDIAFSYITLAALMKQTGQTDLSLAYNKRSFQAFKNLQHGKENTAVTANNIADNYLNLGNYAQALKYAEFADSLMQAENFLKKMKTTYIAVKSNIGKAQKAAGNYASADKTFRKLAEFMQLEFNPDEPILSESYISLAENFLEQKQADSAMYYYRKAQKYMPKNKSIAKGLTKIALQKNNIENAIKASEANLLNRTKAEIKNTERLKAEQFEHKTEASKALLLAADCRIQAYRQSKKTEDAEKALHYTLIADTLMNMQRNTGLIGADDEASAELYHRIAGTAIRAAFDLYEQQKKLSCFNKALQFMNQASAYKLNAEVRQARLYAGTENQNAEALQIKLLQKIREAENRLAVLDNKKQAQNYTRIADSLFSYKKQAFELTFNMQYNSSGMQNFDLFRKLNLSEIQALLDKDELLAAFFTNDEAIYSVFIGKKNFKFLKSTEKDAYSKALQAYYKSIKLSSADLKKRGARMYEILLEPAEDLIAQSNKIIIIPEGIMNRIPFDAFVKNNQYLIEQKSLSYHYSLYLWTEAKNKAGAQTVNHFTGFAPVFSDNELASGNPLIYDAQLRYNYREIVSGSKLAPLPYSEQEVLEIAAMFKKAGKSSDFFLHEQASEASVKKYLHKKGIIHIATHGYSSTDTPKLSGLFLSQKNMNENDVLNDGFLYLGEIFNLESQANLLVLSACKTGTGKIAKGEGVLALPRAFIFAGVPNIVASLWKIHDENTKNLMLDFYTHLLDGKSYSDALRAAKIKQIEKGIPPTDWSGIILIGE